MQDYAKTDNKIAVDVVCFGGSITRRTDPDYWQKDERSSFELRVAKRL